MAEINGNTVGVDNRPVMVVKESMAPLGSDPDSSHSDYAYYRQVGARSLDLSPQTHERMQKLALALYRQNPMAHRIIKMVASFAVPGAVRFEAENNRIHKMLVTHWNHPLNRWDDLFYQCVLELGLYGEVFLLANVMEDGDVTWGYIDPLRVTRIEPDERDLSRPAYVHVLKGASIEKGANLSPDDTIRLPIIRYDGKAGSETQGLRVGQVLYVRTNGILGSLRGVSDLLPLVDYLDGLDQFMFALQQRVQHQNNWIWDVTLEGMSEGDIREWLNSLQGKSPAPGAIRAHNDKVQWQAVAPNFQGEDSTDHVRLFRNYILGGAGLADWVLGDMGSANRAATENSAAVIGKTMQQRQREGRLLIEEVFNFVIDQHKIAGTLPGKRKFKRDFSIALPNIGIRDFQRVANALRQAADGILKLMQAGLVDEERGLRITDELLNQLDLEGVDRDREKNEVVKLRRPEDGADDEKKAGFGRAPAGRNGSKPEKEPETAGDSSRRNKTV